MAAAAPVIMMGLGTLQQYGQKRREGEYVARGLDTNRTLIDEQVADTLRGGDAQARRIKRDTLGTIGAQRVAGASQGLDLSSGTAADLQAEAAQFGEMDRLEAINNAHRQAYGLQVESANYGNEAEQVRQASRSAMRSTLLTGASQLYAQWPRTTASGQMTIPKGTRTSGTRQRYS